MIIVLTSPKKKEKHTPKFTIDVEKNGYDVGFITAGSCLMPTNKTACIIQFN